jgi:hypothetical protein
MYPWLKDRTRYALENFHNIAHVRYYNEHLPELLDRSILDTLSEDEKRYVLLVFNRSRIDKNDEVQIPQDIKLDKEYLDKQYRYRG